MTVAVARATGLQAGYRGAASGAAGGATSGAASGLQAGLQAALHWRHGRRRRRYKRRYKWWHGRRHDHYKWGLKRRYKWRHGRRHGRYKLCNKRRYKWWHGYSLHSSPPSHAFPYEPWAVGAAQGEAYRTYHDFVEVPVCGKGMALHILYLVTSHSSPHNRQQIWCCLHDPNPAFSHYFCGCLCLFCSCCCGAACRGGWC